jgi:hypothetical protein
MTFMTEAGMGAEWREYALRLRAVLEQVGVTVPPCLPGEERDCGSDYAHHCMGYLAMLKAKADAGLWHMHHGEPGGQQMAEQLHEHWRGVLAAETALAAEHHGPSPGCQLTRLSRQLR